MQTLQTLTESPIGYLQLYQSQQTVNQINTALRKYLEALTGRTPTDLDSAAREYFESRGRDPLNYKRDVQAFFISMRHSAPKTIRARLSHIKQLLLRNDVELPNLFWRDLQRKLRGNRAITVDGVPTNEQLRKVIFQMPVMGKAVTLTAASSGARIGELLSLQMEDLDMSQDPIRLTIRAETSKERGYRIVFGSKEAKEAIQQWLKVREKWLDAAVRKTTKLKQVGRRHLDHQVYKDPKDTRLFPVTQTTIHQMYTRALDKAGFLRRDPRTGVSTLHFHTLRKLFRTRLGPVMNQDIIEALMGHEAYLTEAYRRYTTDQLAEFYRKAEPALWILSDMAPMAEDIEGLKKENRELKTKVEGLEKALINYLAGYKKV